MANKPIRKSFSSIILNSSLISATVNQNANVINRYGIDVPTFTTDLDTNIAKAKELNQHQERMKSELKNITLELNNVLSNIEKQYALCKKTVKLAEPQAKWVAYGISDKK